MRDKRRIFRGALFVSSLVSSGHSLKLKSIPGWSLNCPISFSFLSNIPFLFSANVKGERKKNKESTNMLACSKIRAVFLAFMFLHPSSQNRRACCVLWAWPNCSRLIYSLRFFPTLFTNLFSIPSRNSEPGKKLNQNRFSLPKSNSTLSNRNSKSRATDSKECYCPKKCIVLYNLFRHNLKKLEKISEKGQGTGDLELTLFLVLCLFKHLPSWLL